MSRIDPYQRAKVVALTLATIAACAWAVLSCTSYVLGPADKASLLDGLELGARANAIIPTDGGPTPPRARLYVQGEFCAGWLVLEHSHDAPEAGLYPIECGVSPVKP